MIKHKMEQERIVFVQAFWKHSGKSKDLDFLILSGTSLG